MTDTPATHAASELGVDHRVVRFGAVDSIEEAARVRGISIAAITKTIAVRAEGRICLVAVPGDRAIDWKKLRAHLGVARAALVDTDTLEEETGYPRGAVTPFGARGNPPLVVDVALLDQSEVSTGGGVRGVAIHLSPIDLVAAFQADVADVTRPRG